MLEKVKRKLLDYLIPLLTIGLVLTSTLLVGCMGSLDSQYDSEEKRHSKSLSENATLGVVCNYQDLSKQIIAIDQRGVYTRINLKKGGTQNELNQQIKELEAALDGARLRIGAKPLDVLVFIHGGLNTYKTSIQRIEQQYESMCKAGFFPIFVIWPSGAFESYFDSVKSYYQGDWGNSAYLWSVPFKLGTDALEVVGRSLLNYAKQFNVWATSSCYNESLRKTFSFYCKRGNGTDPRNDPCQATGVEDGKPVAHGYSCAPVTHQDARKFVVQRLDEQIGTPLKAISVPLMDPLGERAWNSMLARASFAFRLPCPTDSGGSQGDCSSGAVMQLFEMIKKFNDKVTAINRYETGRANLPTIEGYDDLPLRITLIAHSMGAFVATDIVRTFADLPYTDVVFLGAAVSFHEYKTVIESTIREHADQFCGRIAAKCLKYESDWWKRTRFPFRFYNVSLHPYAEAAEENFGGVVPSGSLLEWIDFNFTSPADISERTVGRWANVAALSQLNNEALLTAGLIHFRRFGLSTGQPRGHGKFLTSSYRNAEGIDYSYWEREYWFPKVDEKFMSLRKVCEVVKGESGFPKAEMDSSSISR